MSSRTLETDLYMLQRHVGDHAGYGRGARFVDTAWTVDQQMKIDEAVVSGCRKVYFTEEMDGIPGSYQWSFLQPRSTIELPEGTQELILPRDCNGLLGDVIPASNDGVAQFTLRVVPYATIYTLRSQSPTQTGRPTMCSEQIVKGTTLTQGSRYKLQIWPTRTPITRSRSGTN
jgi:hypothetical protein